MEQTASNENGPIAVLIENTPGNIRQAERELGIGLRDEADNGWRPETAEDRVGLVSLCTGILCGSFSDMHRVAEKVMGQPVFTHQFAMDHDRIVRRAIPAFLTLMREDHPLRVAVAGGAK